jgi:diguanylate cyclase (GGDEF)-like protein
MKGSSMNAIKLYLLDFKDLLLKDKDYLIKQFEDHKHISGLLFFLYAFLGPILWIWDYNLDPIGAQSTIFLRLSYLIIFSISGFAFFYFKNVRFLFILSVVSILFSEFIFVIILNKLDSGMSYGIAGFMYFLFFGLLVFQAFPLYCNFIYSLSVIIFPHFLGFIGVASNFEHMNYATLLYPGVFTAMIMQLVYAKSYEYRYNYEKELKIASTTDFLTKAYNRNKINNVLTHLYKKYKRNSIPFGVIILDIDYFKNVNDTFGHNRGDEVLREFSCVVKNNIREIDIFGRWGGEEFIVIVEDIDIENLFMIAEKIRNAIANTKFTKVKSISASVGAAVIKEDDTVESLIARADRGLYKSKEEGRNKTTVLEIAT